MEREHYPSAVEQADVVLNDYVKEKLSGAYEKIMRLQSDEPGICRCPNCQKEAVSEINSYLGFVCGENEELYNDMHYEVVNYPNGSIGIVQGCCDEPPVEY